MDYTSEQLLLDALDSGDCVTVKRCIEAGQNLDQGFGGSPISHLMSSILQLNLDRFCTILAFKKHININLVNPFSFTALYYAASLPEETGFLHLLIQNGAELEIEDSEEMTPFEVLSKFDWLPNRITKMLMLLSVGADPITAVPDESVKRHVRKWLSCLECAKFHFKKIFDNPTLENLLCGFIFNEAFLRKAL